MDNRAILGFTCEWIQVSGDVVTRIKIHFEEPVLFSMDVPVRIGDINYGKHLGHDSLISILHDVRAQCLKAFGMDELDIDGCVAMIADLAVRYLSEAFHGQVLTVDVALGDIHPKGFDLAYRVTDSDSGKPIALAKTGLVFFDPSKREACGHPPRFRAFLAVHR